MINDVLASAKDLLNGWEPVRKNKQEWKDREEALHESWEEMRQTLFERLLQSTYAPRNSICSVCCKSPGIIRCRECYEHQYLCPICDQNQHTLNVFHDREILQDGHFEPISSTCSQNSIGEWVTIGIAFDVLILIPGNLLLFLNQSIVCLFVDHIIYSPGMNWLKCLWEHIRVLPSNICTQ